MCGCEAVYCLSDNGRTPGLRQSDVPYGIPDVCLRPRSKDVLNTLCGRKYGRLGVIQNPGCAMALQTKTTLLVIRRFRLELTECSEATRSGSHRLQVSSTTVPLHGGCAEPQNEELEDVGFRACNERRRIPSAA